MRDPNAVSLLVPHGSQDQNSDKEDVLLESRYFCFLAH